MVFMRTFIAIDLPDEIKSRIADVSEQFSASGIVIVQRDVLHISLHFLGERSDEEIEKIKEAMGELRAKQFRIEIKELGVFTPDYLKVVFAKVAAGREECESIYNQLSTSMSSRGFQLEQRDYTPHVTIARVKRLKDKRRVLSLIDEYSNEGFGSFEATSVKLKASELTEDGPVYRDLYEVKL